MDRRLGFALVLVLMALMGLVGTAKADGIIIPDPPCPQFDCPPWKPPVCEPGKTCPPVPPRPRPIASLQVKTHRVSVRIDNQVAVTHVDQVFYNPNTWTLEGTYIFPLPADAAVSKFALWVDGKPVEGKILSAEEARRYYEDTVRQQRDPALLEYIGRGTVQARIFPIPPKGERAIELEYSQVLTAENGLIRFSYPLNTEKFSAAPLADVSVTVEIHSNQPVQAVYSPSHPISVDRKDSRTVIAGWEAKHVKPDQDFLLFYSIGQSEAFHLLSYRDPMDSQDPDGFFLLMLAPRPELPDKAVSKDVILVLDRSGSMEGEKFKQAQAALQYILKHLNDGDRFGLISFSTTVQPYARGLRPAEEAAEASAWVNRLSAGGSTDINRALLDAVSMANNERPTYLIFMTDGLPTVGETKRDSILSNFAKAVSKNVRLFAFGVGYDVDTLLLDTLSQQHHGLSTYVKPGEKLDEILSSFYERISTPVLTDLALDFGKMSIYDLYPSPMPDLFNGSQVIAVGRYKDSGKTDVILKGTVNGEGQTFTFSGQEFTADSRGSKAALATLPRLWATRKIGYLLNQVRLKGADKETIDQIVKLSIRYGIITPYTSYLVTEPMPLGAENQQHVAQEALRTAQSAPQAASGQGAVQKSADQGALAQAEQAASLPQGENQTVVIAGARTFVLSQGVWTDTAYDPGKMKTRKVPFLSGDYFRLSQSRADIAAALALGSRVIVVVDGVPYEVVAETETQPTLVLPATLTPMPQPRLTATPVPTLPGTKPTLPGANPTLPAMNPTVPGLPPEPPSPGSWLPLAGLGIGVVVCLAIALFAWLRRR